MFEDVKVNSHGTNVAIKAHILPDDEMYDIGFKDYYPNKEDTKIDYWYYLKSIPRLGRGIDIDFEVKIPKDGSDIEIMTIDCDYGQYYDYQRILSRHPTLECALKVQDFVEKQMERLQERGVLSGHNKGEYI